MPRTWLNSAPTSDGGSPITSYTVTTTPGGATTTATGSPVTIAGLTDGGSYSFQITATNSVGQSAASTPRRVDVRERTFTANASVR